MHLGRRIAVVAMAVAVSASTSATPAGPNSRLHRDQQPASLRLGGIDTFVTARATRLFDGGQPFYFRGFNLYNINGRGDCGFEIPDLDAELDAIGPSANVVRGWFFQRLATDPATGRLDWSVFDETLVTLRARGIRVIATLADEWGACDGNEPRDRLTLEWYRAGYRSAPYASGAPLSYRDWVSAIGYRYRDDPTILAWQLMNEAEAPIRSDGTCDEAAAVDALRAWASDVAGVVKQRDPNHLLSLGTIGGGQCGMRGPDYRTLHAIPEIDLCEHHDYRYWQLVPDDLRYDLAICGELGKPTFVGEFGISAATFGGDLGARAIAIASKQAAARRAGVVGSLVWAWRSDGDGGSSALGFDVGPGDPLLQRLPAGSRCDLGRPAHQSATTSPGRAAT
jgi:mannan endo-1,4-beta-mannosidase